MTKPRPTARKPSKTAENLDELISTAANTNTTIRLTATGTSPEDEEPAPNEGQNRNPNPEHDDDDVPPFLHRSNYRPPSVENDNSEDDGSSTTSSGKSSDSNKNPTSDESSSDESSSDESTDEDIPTKRRRKHKAKSASRKKKYRLAHKDKAKVRRNHAKAVAKNEQHSSASQVNDRFKALEEKLAKTIKDGEELRKQLATPRKSRKRARSIDSDDTFHDDLSKVHIEKPPVYKGENRREYDNWTRRVETTFHAKKKIYAKDKAKVLFAEPFIFDTINTAWHIEKKERRRAGKTLTWGSLKRFLKTQLGDAGTLEYTAQQEYADIHQKWDQSPAEFAIKLKELEAQIQPMSTDTKVSSLLTKLVKDVREDYIAAHGYPSNINDLISKSTAIWNKNKRQRDRNAHPGAPRTSRRTDPVNREPRTPEQQKQYEERKAKDQQENRCYRCHEPGHIGRDCPKYAHLPDNRPYRGPYTPPVQTPVQPPAEPAGNAAGR